jgi:hypothetical protein
MLMSLASMAAACSGGTTANGDACANTNGIPAAINSSMTAQRYAGSPGQKKLPKEIYDHYQIKRRSTRKGGNTNIDNRFGTMTLVDAIQEGHNFNAFFRHRGLGGLANLRFRGAGRANRPQCFAAGLEPGVTHSLSRFAVQTHGTWK